MEKIDRLLANDQREEVVFQGVKCNWPENRKSMDVECGYKRSTMKWNERIINFEEEISLRGGVRL
jgi:hypothetical protein